MERTLYFGPLFGKQLRGVFMACLLCLSKDLFECSPLLVIDFSVDIWERSRWFEILSVNEALTTSNSR